jgi:hypothetical protein
VADPFADAVGGAVGDDGLAVADGVDGDAAAVLTQFGEVEPPVRRGGDTGAGAVQEQDRGALAQLVVVGQLAVGGGQPFVV